ncbi:hypothetical protein LX97_01318 [Nonlabens dokdonensis]|jgi:hypothetical protein|uniref:Uncharacterized protein n=2 Tax=Nonlabens dokdonensis TaxID=328515 RepID=L7W8V8_NONDD|nr:hypothetical protein [Nonlabens dokdonensis]AGC76657.1 hypothetical protein DDD_1530 [Nonlabens dokdonensis DSW-6]PZX44307.1 hypothetical protein LX97_01318 [Nonlabens dokdonensis]
MKILLLFLVFGAHMLSAATKDVKTIHVYVALCDNVNQGIAPVPEQIGNGQNPFHNLYWGAGYGLKTYFKKSKDWSLIRIVKDVDSLILERVLFKHKKSGTYLLADAYDGAYIKQTTIDFLEASAGRNGFQINDGDTQLCFGGDANLLSYIGHNGLMEFDVNGAFSQPSTNKIETIILACYSKHYFSKYLKQTNAIPLLWTSHLMAPEAYTLKYAIDGWINKEKNTKIAERAALAYHKYQRCGINAARKLLVTGF